VIHNPTFKNSRGKLKGGKKILLHLLLQMKVLKLNSCYPIDINIIVSVTTVINTRVYATFESISRFYRPLLF